MISDLPGVNDCLTYCNLMVAVGSGVLCGSIRRLRAETFIAQYTPLIIMRLFLSFYK